MNEDIELELQCKYCDYEEILHVPESDYDAWAGNGVPIQEVFDYLSAGQRELMISGTCDTCWNKFFPNAEGDDEVSDNRTVTLSKHEVVLDIDTVDAIWEIAHGVDGWNREFPDNETIKVLRSYEKKAHMYDQMLELLGFKPEEDY
tara:strand:+ start:433 stop:870 length:438 start_codon:yes stop_codon:yes gene_type:complete